MLRPPQSRVLVETSSPASTLCDSPFFNILDYRRQVDSIQPWMSAAIPQQLDFLFELNQKVKQLPLPYRNQCHPNLLSELANALVDGTVFDIVSGLRDIQRMTEKDHFQYRCKVVQEQKATRADLVTKQKAAKQKEQRAHHLPVLQRQQYEELAALDSRHRRDLRDVDKKIILDLDELAQQQQQTLEKAGVPGFFVTTEPDEVRLQMYLTQFILDLSMQYKPS